MTKSKTNSHGVHHWVTRGDELVQELYRIGAVVSGWATGTVLLGGLFALFTSKKAN
jgi:hypothetical protein